MAEVLIKKVMDENGIKVDRLLLQLDISRSTVYRIIRGDKVPNIVELEKFAKALIVPIEDLYDSEYSRKHKMSQI